MPEGDTIHRAARRLARVLEGKSVTVASSTAIAVEPIQGRTVTRVEAHGKHLLFSFENGLLLRTHLGMHGAWHVYRRGERWRKPKHLAAIALVTEAAALVCFDPSSVELLRSDQDGILARLGPDPLRPDFSAAEAMARLRALGEQAIGIALLEQRALAGVGNVLKSEILFRCGVHPETPVARLADAELEALVATATRLLKRGTGRGPRTTRLASDGPRLWVYRRSGEHCLKCGTTIELVRQGVARRSTYFCPSCQPRR